MTSIWSGDKRIKTEFSSTYRSLGRLDQFDHQLECERLAPLVPAPGGSCLDLAAGNGRFTAFLAAHGCRVVAVDLEPSHADFLRQRFAGNPSVEVVCGDAVAHLQAEERRYDLIIISGLLLFFADAEAEAIIATARRRLTPGGHLVVRDFATRVGSWQVPSEVFPGVTLHYRSDAFYRGIGARWVEVCRPNHNFSGYYGFLTVLGYRAYRATLGRPRLMRASWALSGYRNVMIAFGAANA